LHDNFRIAGGLEVSSFPLQPVAQVARIHQIAVMRDRDKTASRVHANRLGVEQRRISSGGIPGVADGHFTGKLGEDVFGEDIRHQPHTFDIGKLVIVGGRNAGRFLAAVLQRIKSEICLMGRIGVPVDRDHAALLAQLIERDPVVVFCPKLPHSCFPPADSHLRSNPSFSPEDRWPVARPALPPTNFVAPKRSPESAPGYRLPVQRYRR